MKKYIKPEIEVIQLMSLSNIISVSNDREIPVMPEETIDGEDEFLSKEDYNIWDDD